MKSTTKNKNWHSIISKKSKRPNNKVVVGYYRDESYEFAILCYFDEKLNEWYSASPETRGDELNEPDYWIELPD